MPLIWGDIPATTSYNPSCCICGDSAGTGYVFRNLQLKHINVLVPAPSVGGNFFFRAQQAMKIIRVDGCVRTSLTTATFNIEVHSDLLTAGTNVLSSDMAADNDGETVTSFNTSTINEGDWLFIDVSAVSGSPTMLSVTITCRLTT
jgi:hypothetical protein